MNAETPKEMIPQRRGDAEVGDVCSHPSLMRNYDESPGLGLTVCADCPDKPQCAAYGECVGNILAEAQDIREDYIAAGVCSECGACSLTDANNKCRPKQYPSGEYSCAGELLWHQEDGGDVLPDETQNEEVSDAAVEEIICK